MSVGSLQIPVEYIITTSSDWMEFQIVEGGWWNGGEIECLTGCNRLRRAVFKDKTTIRIVQVPEDTASVEVRAKCILNINKGHLDSQIAHKITKGDLNSTTVRIIVQGKEIEKRTNKFNVPEDPYNPFTFEIPTSQYVSAFERPKTTIDYKELATRVAKFKKYEGLFGFFTRYWFLVLIIAVVGSPLATWQLFGRLPTYWETTGITLLVVVPWTLIISVVQKRMRKYIVEDNEWAMFFTNSILDNLVKYSNTRNPEMKKDYRKNSVKIAEDFLSCITERWKIGRFKLVQDHFGESMSELKKNLRYRVIPSLKDGDDAMLGQIEQIMRNFRWETKSLSLEGIKKLNEQMSSRLPTTEDMKAGFLDRLSAFFGTHKIAKHGLFVASLLIGCSVFYYMAVTYIEISKDYAFAAGVAVFVGLTTIYFRKQPKE